MTSLTDALEWLEAWSHDAVSFRPIPIHRWPEIKELATAARWVAEAPQVLWCQVHHSMEATTEQAGVCWLFDGDQDCRMVRKLLVDPPHPQPDQEDE